jgi:hypothetical protein
MGLETVTYIGDLVTTNPTASDAKSQGDDHLRAIKTALKNSLAGFAGAVLITGTDGGAANAYTVTTGQSLAAYSTKNLVLFAPVATSTGPSTLNVDGIGAVSIKTDAGAAIALNDLVYGRLYLAVHNGTEFRLLSTLKNYCDQLAFSSALPAQIADYFVTSNGTTASFSNLLKAGTMRFADSSDTTKRIAFSAAGITTGTTRTITAPDKDLTLGTGWYFITSSTVGSAVASIDFLNTFSSTYDDYVVIIENLSMASADELSMQFATSGTADSGTNYNWSGRGQPHTGAGTDNGAANANSLKLQSDGGGTNASTHQSAMIFIHNINSSNYKQAFSKNAYKGNGGLFYSATANLTYTNSSVVTGFKLFLAGGANIDAGTVKVYGVAKS